MALRINEVNMRVEPGGAADINLMDEHQYKALLNRIEKKPVLDVSTIKLSTPQTELVCRVKQDARNNSKDCCDSRTY